MIEPRPVSAQPLPGFDTIAALTEPIRPWRYLVIDREIDLDDDFNEVGKPSHTVVDVTNDVEYAIGWCEGDYLDPLERPGAIDNWAGAWLVEPAWSDEVCISGEGFARYDLRPEPDQPTKETTT